MPAKYILNNQERKEFDLPPKLNSFERKQLFRNTGDVRKVNDKLRKDENRVAFILMCGYFKAGGKIFNHFYEQDWDYVIHQLGSNTKYKIKLRDQAFNRIKIFVLQIYGLRDFKGQAILSDSINLHLKSQQSDRYIFERLCDKMIKESIIIPSFFSLNHFITSLRLDYDSVIESKISKSITSKTKTLIDNLFTKSSSDHVNSKYKISALKRFHQSNKVTKIRNNLDSLERLRNLFNSLSEARNVLDFTDEGIKFYANIAIKKQYFQIERRSEESRLIYLVCFITHQYRVLNDILAETIISTVNQFKSRAKSALEREYLEHREDQQEFNKIAKKSRNNFETYLSNSKEILFNSKLSNDEKIDQLKNLYSYTSDQKRTTFSSTKNLDIINKIEGQSKRNLNDFKVQNIRFATMRLKKVIKALEFNTTDPSTNTELLEAIDYYNQKDGNIGKNAPIDFLSVEEQKRVCKSKQFNSNLWKVFLFEHLSQSLKSGRLNLEYSYDYRSSEKYLIPVDEWTNNRENLIHQAELEGVSSGLEIIESLREKTAHNYKETNNNILTGNNPDFYTLVSGDMEKYNLKSHRLSEHKDKIQDLIPSDLYIPIQTVMFKASMDSEYESLIQHSDNLRKRKSINTPDLLATIFAMGCNLGLSRASIITGRNENDLDYINRWYLNKENIDTMNDKVVELITKLNLPNIYNIDNKTYTASDGSHVVNRQATFKAKHSYKYGSSIPASSQYSHVDHRYIVFYSTMISASAQEAPNVIDGLLHCKWIRSDIHSTDTFGSTEPVFGLCYLLGFDLVPRIKNLFDVRLYSFDNPKNYDTHPRKKHWKIKPVKKINTELILSEWDSLLHLAISIKLEYCSASTILKRLNSYSRKNRLYLALRELGRAVRTNMILRYIDDAGLRMQVQKMLNSIENSNKFSKQIRFGNNGELFRVNKIDLDIAEGCRRLIQNSIIYYNYSLLTSIVQDLLTSQRGKALETIKHGSPMCWSHINFRGKYDFENIPEPIELKSDQIREFRLG